MGIPTPTTGPAVETAVLDHAREFSELVLGETPAEYRALLASGRFDEWLAEGGSFNHGKLYAYAEFRVFRSEFRRRFPEASAAACINAFSGLFLKNDISMHNLLELVEAPPEPGFESLPGPD